MISSFPTSTLPPCHEILQLDQPKLKVTDPYQIRAPNIEEIDLLMALRVRGGSRANTRRRVYEEACHVMESVRALLSLARANRCVDVTLLCQLESRMQVLLNQMGQVMAQEEAEREIWRMVGHV
ncbi:hypothetical protein N7517_004724 [Penicillium concentricum]|uniref:Uncharacterized protein n=1 Tax=Penicillium concentricum TaxID=293559 RepID=A0A9W9SAS2_9EURO|nr:uncharacterized protein N7517_004724 [Penicillium concentricum]KAJ5372718.1 hypothetical protein N7517_004724 [Penicillium concentricum]